jgi:hypothetical protein
MPRDSKSTPRAAAKAKPARTARKAPRTRPAPAPAADEGAERERFVESLRCHGQLHEGKGPLPPGATHVVVPKKKRGRAGTPAVERRRFSIV